MEKNLILYYLPASAAAAEHRHPYYDTKEIGRIPFEQISPKYLLYWIKDEMCPFYGIDFRLDNIFISSRKNNLYRRNIREYTKKFRNSWVLENV